MTELLVTRNLGLLDYEISLLKMQKFTNSRNKNTPDELWLVQHPPVFTLGSSGEKEQLLVPTDIPVVNSDRGGKITYHGPGQCLVYIMVDLQRIGLGVRSLVNLIESSMVDLLLTYQISAHRNHDAPGVYVQNEKIASLGLRIRRGLSYHGVALNVDMDLSPFNSINTCGYVDLKVTSMALWSSMIKAERVGVDMLEVLTSSLKPLYKGVKTFNE